MLDIVAHEPEGGVLQKDIAERQELSIKYLDHIIRALKRSNLIVNVGGRKSGYRLKRKPQSISIYDIYLAFEQELCIVDCISNFSSCEMEKNCKTRRCWCNLNKVIVNYLSGLTLKDIMNSNYLVEKTV